MKTCSLVNVCKFYTRLNAFRVDGEFTDVTFKCADGDETFKCHRLALAAASDHFRDMFKTSINECITENIVLPTVKRATFRRVLQFIYTGHAMVDRDNFWDVFRASKSFRLSGLRDLCVSFVKKNVGKFTVQNILSMYSFAHENEDDLVDILRPHIVERLETIYEMSEFLEMPFNGLREIVRQRLHPSVQTNSTDEEAVLAAMSRWVRHKSRDRLQKAYELVKFTSSSIVKREFEESVTSSSSTSDEAVPPSTCGHVPVVVEYNRPSTALHVYVSFAQEDVIRIFSIDGSTGECAATGTISGGDFGENFTTIALENTVLFRLLYYGHSGPLPEEEEQNFFAYMSANMQTALPLKLPPIYFEDVSLCEIRNIIYAYHESLPSDPMRTWSMHGSRIWNDEEIVRGIFGYNCEVDYWFPIPAMGSVVQWASMTSLDDTLFLIGGYSPTDAFRTKVQAYDRREKAWRELPGTEKSYFEASACCLYGKIYVFGGFGNIHCERYDPIAGRWERLANMEYSLALCSKSIPYQNKIWLFDRDPICRQPGDNARDRRHLYFQTGTNRLNADSPLQTFTWSRESIDLTWENATNCVDSVVFEKIRPDDNASGTVSIHDG